MRVLAALSALACGEPEAGPGPGPGPGSGSETGAGSDTGPGPGSGSGETADTGDPIDWTGTYVGRMTVIAADVVGDAHTYALCSDPAFTIVVDVSGGMSGGGACTMPAPLEGKTFGVTLVGLLGAPPDPAGSVTITWPSVPKPLLEEWVADVEAPSTIDGHFEGTWSEGDLRFDYGAEFLLER